MDVGARIGRLDDGFDQFVVARSTALLRTAVLLTAGDRQLAEDLLQTSLLRLARNWPRARAHPEAYVRTVLVNLSRDAARHRRRRVVELPVAEPPDRPHPAPPSDAPDTLIAALRDLPERQRATVVLRFWEDRSVAETAALLACAEGTVKSNTARALERLRTVLGDPAELTEGARRAD